MKFMWIISPVIALFFLDAAGQELGSTHINQVDSRGRKQGYWKIYDSSGELKFQGNYLDGKPVGDFVFYYPSGRKQAEVKNQDQGKVTYMRMYHPDGKLAATGKYINQKKDSTWQYFNHEDGTLASEDFYLNTLKSGEWKTYYPSGQVMEVTTYRDDIRQGPWIQYFSDGSVKAEGTYIDDVLDGQFTVRHLNGKVEISGQLVNGVKEGTWVYLNEIGELLIKEIYKNGDLIKREEKVAAQDAQK